MALTQKKYEKKIFDVGPPWARGHSLKGARITFFECSHTSTSHSFRDIWVKFSRHITLGGYIHFSKNVGGQTPWGEIFPKVFLEILI